MDIRNGEIRGAEGKKEGTDSLAEDILHALRMEACLENRTYNNEEIENLKANKAELDTVSFIGCHFTGCDFGGGTFLNVTFDTCDFSNCKFADCYMKNVRFADCKGDGADFRECAMICTVLEKGSFYYTNFSNALWESSVIREASLKHAFFAECRLKRVKFEQVDFSETDFFRTMLKGIDVSTCNMEGIMVSESFSEVKGMKINIGQAVDLAMLLGVTLGKNPE